MGQKHLNAVDSESGESSSEKFSLLPLPVRRRDPRTEECPSDLEGQCRTRNTRFRSVQRALLERTVYRLRNGIAASLGLFPNVRGRSEVLTKRRKFTPEEDVNKVPRSQNSFVIYRFMETARRRAARRFGNTFLHFCNSLHVLG